MSVLIFLVSPNHFQTSQDTPNLFEIICICWGFFLSLTTSRSFWCQILWLFKKTTNFIFKLLFTKICPLKLLKFLKKLTRPQTKKHCIIFVLFIRKYQLFQFLRPLGTSQPNLLDRSFPNFDKT